MVTKVRPPNKTLWALNEAIEHDTEIVELLEQLLNQMEKEQEEAKRRFDKAGQVRLAQTFVTLAKLQLHINRLANLHRQARNNEYDRR